MGRARAALLVAALAGLLHSHATFAGEPREVREVVDALGAHVPLPEHPARIVTLAPSLGELVADLAGTSLEKIVGVSDYTDYPPALAHVPSVGSYAHFNLEAVVALRPDLVIATADGNAPDQIEHLRELKIPVVVVKTSSFNDIKSSLRIVSQATGEQKLGNELIERLEKGLHALELKKKARAQAGEKPRRVLLQLDWSPLVVAGKGTFLNEALSQVGAVNVYENVQKPYPKPSVEDVVQRDPDVIVVLGMDRNYASFEQAGRDWQKFPKMKAVREKRVHVIRADAIIRPSMRILEGLTLLDRVVHE